MSRRNSLGAKRVRREARFHRDRAQPGHSAVGICRGACGDSRYRTLIRPERICVPCFDKLVSSLATLPRIFGA